MRQARKCPAIVARREAQERLGEYSDFFSARRMSNKTLQNTICQLRLRGPFETSARKHEVLQDRMRTCLFYACCQPIHNKNLPSSADIACQKKKFSLQDRCAKVALGGQLSMLACRCYFCLHSCRHNTSAMQQQACFCTDQDGPTGAPAAFSGLASI